MKKIIFIGMGIIAIALLVSGCTTTQQQPPQSTPPQNQPSPSTTTQVTIQDFKFQPAEIAISQGSIVTWTNQDDVEHTVKFTFEESGLLGKGETYSHTFNDKGTFDYECGPHPFMKGKVTVI